MWRFDHFTCVVRGVPRERRPHWISAELLEAVRAHIQTRWVHGLVPTYICVDQTELVAVISHRRARQQHLNHVQSVDQHRIGPSGHSCVVVVTQLQEMAWGGESSQRQYYCHYDYYYYIIFILFRAYHPVRPHAFGHVLKPLFHHRVNFFGVGLLVERTDEHEVEWKMSAGRRVISVV